MYDTARIAAGRYLIPISRACIAVVAMRLSARPVADIARRLEVVNERMELGFNRSTVNLVLHVGCNGIFQLSFSAFYNWGLNHGQQTSNSAAVPLVQDMSGLGRVG